MSSTAVHPAPGRPRWHWGALVLLVVMVLLPWVGPDGSWSQDGTGEGDGTGSLDGGDDGATGPVAHVQGQVFIEQPRTEAIEPSMPAVIETGGASTTGGGLEPDGARETGGASTTGGGLEPDGATAIGGGIDSEVGASGDVDGTTGVFGTTGADGADWDADTDTETDGAWNAGLEEDAPPPTPPPVDLLPPPLGQCHAIAWQQGERVSEPTPCDADGHFEVALHPDRHGRVAFEILVPGHLRAVLEVDVPPAGTGRLPPVALGLAERVDGQVVDGRGNPLPDIVIEAMPTPNLGEPEPWRATSGPDGAFAFETLPPGPVTLRATAPGFAPSVVEVLSPQADLLVTLQALVDLRGRVVGPPEALARAKVRIEGSGIWPVRVEPVAPDGHFVLPQIPDGIYALEAVVEADVPGAVELASIPLENVTPDLALTLALVPAVRVPVEVHDPGGVPVPDARVTLSNSSIGLLPKIAVTDASGQVSMGPVVPGPYVLRAAADGYLPAPAIPLTVEPEGVALQVLRLGKPGRIEGQVVDDGGRPVPDARVELSAEHVFTVGEQQARARFAQASLRAAGSLGVTTGPVPAVPLDDDAARMEDTGTSVHADADGRFAFELLAPGTYRLEASHGHYAHSDAHTVRLGAARDQRGVRLVLRTGHRLTGRVLDGNDRPIEGARVRFSDGRHTYTDARGVFDGGIRRGRQRIVADADGLAPREVEVTVVDDDVDVDINLLRARARLSGRVEGGNGEALEGARVTLRTVDGLSHTRVAWTDAWGSYRFEDLPAGPVELEVDHPDHGPAQARATLDAEDDDAQVDVRLVAGWSITIDVLTEGTAEPLSGVRVDGGGRHARTDADGRAVLRHLVDERVHVTVRAEGYGVRELHVDRDGADAQSRRVLVSEGGGLRGRVTDYRGDAVAGVTVVVRDLAGVELARTRTDVDGQWSVGDVPPGDVRVSADPPIDREDELAPTAERSDVLRGHVTPSVDLRFERR